MGEYFVSVRIIAVGGIANRFEWRASRHINTNPTANQLTRLETAKITGFSTSFPGASHAAGQYFKTKSRAQKSRTLSPCIRHQPQYIPGNMRSGGVMPIGRNAAAGGGFIGEDSAADHDDKVLIAGSAPGKADGFRQTGQPMLALQCHAHAEVQHIEPVGPQEFLQGGVIDGEFALRAPALVPHRLGIQRRTEAVEFARQGYNEHMRGVCQAERRLQAFHAEQPDGAL